MADIKTVISGIVYVQDKTISKLKFNNSAIIGLSGDLNTLSSIINNANYINQSTLSENYYNKSETDEKFNEYIKNELDPKFAAQSSQFALKSEIGSLIGEELDPKFAEVSGQFALKSEIEDLISEEIDPKFAAASGDFVTHTDLEEFHTYDNLTYVNKIYQTMDQSGDAIPGFETFAEIPESTTSGEILDLRADGGFYTWIDNGYGKFLFARKSNTAISNSIVYSFPTNVNNFKNLSRGRDVVYGITADGNLYVAIGKCHGTITENTRDGTLLGDTLTISEASKWVQVPNISNCYYVRSFWGNTALLAGDGLSGTLYMAGYNLYQMLGSAGYDENNNPQITKNYTSNKENTFLLNTLKPITIIENGNRITPNDWVRVEKGTRNVLAQRANGKLYVWGCDIFGLNGNGIHYWTDITDAEVAEETNNAYTRKIDLGTSEPSVLKVRVYSGNSYTDVEYDDWIDFSCDYYHAAAIRHDQATGKNLIYFWGSNEYGQFGNGNYAATAYEGGDVGEESKHFEYLDRPTLVGTGTLSAVFPYTDAVKVKTTHYGTFITRANGDIYFAGSNKRNYLGIYSKSTGMETFFTKFTKVNFLSDNFNCETYGAVLVRNVPYIKEDSDALLKTVLSGQLATNKLADASVMAHIHTINPSVIDDVVSVTQSYLPKFQTLVSNSHSHDNRSTLNKLTDSNGVLLLDGQPIVAGTSTGGAVMEIDPSNVKLDNFASVLGMSNIAGGYPLDIISYQADSTNNKSYIVVSQMREGSYKDLDRWPAVYLKSGSDYSSFLTSDALRKGGWAIIYKSANSFTQSNILSSYLLTSIESVRQFFEDVNKNTNYRGYIYDLSAMDSSNWAGGTVIKSGISKSSYPTSGIYVEYDAGTIGRDNSIHNAVKPDSNYIPLSSVASFGVGTAHMADSTNRYLNVYNSVGDLLITSAVISAGIYNDAGQKVKFTSQLIDVKSYDGNADPIYYDYYDNSSLTGDPILSGTQISDGIYKKTGTVLNKITHQDAYEVFDTSLFEIGGEIYIRPSLEDYTGMANQKYEIEAMIPISSTYLNSIENVYPLEYMILKLSSEIKSDTSTSLTFSPGSAFDPMVAIVKSKYRNSTAEVGGEYNGTAGYNSISNGNNNVTVGDFSTTFGVQNTNAGMLSIVAGLANGNTGSSSYIFGERNAIAGSYAFVWGNSNGNDGQSAFLIGSRNFNSGTSNFIIGTSNTADGNRSFLIGSRNYVAENINDNILIGNSIYSECNKSISIGWNGEIEKYEGSFPSDDAAITMTAATLETGINNGTYVSGGLYYQNSFHICMGDKIARNEDKHLDVLTYTKYRWEINDSYFALANTSSARSGKDSRLIVPDHRWTFTGRMYMNFTEAELQSGSTDTFNVSVRNGGRVKTCDPGLNILASSLVYLDYNLGSRFKVKSTLGGESYSGSTTFSLSNFGDGDELDLIIYGGVDFAFPNDWDVDTLESVVSENSNACVFYKIYNIDDNIIAQLIRKLRVSILNRQIH